MILKASGLGAFFFIMQTAADEMRAAYKAGFKDST